MISLEGTPPPRLTRQVSLRELEPFCRCLQMVFTTVYAPGEVPSLWRQLVSAECPACGIRVMGDELRALALAPCEELASAKIGRMRLGYCARDGCLAWDYAVHFWDREQIAWPRLLAEVDKVVQEPASSIASGSRPYLPAWAWGNYAARGAAVFGSLLALWLCREFYLGGRIPYLREPERFIIDTTLPDSNWPVPIDQP